MPDSPYKTIKNEVTHKSDCYCNDDVRVEDELAVALVAKAEISEHVLSCKDEARKTTVFRICYSIF